MIRPIFLTTLLLLAAGCAQSPRRITPNLDPGIPIAVMPLGLPGDTRPCQVARADLRAPVRPVPVIPGSDLSYERLPVSLPGGGETTAHDGILSPGGDTVALMTLGPQGTQLSIQELRTGRQLALVDSIWSPAGSSGLAWSRDGRWIASAQQWRTVKIVSVKEARVHAELPHTRYTPKGLPPIYGPPPETWYTVLSSVAFSPDGGALVSAGEDGNVILWDLRSRRARWIHDLRGGRGHPPRGVQVAFDPDGRLLVMSPRGLEVWSAERGEVLGRLHVPVGAVPWMRDSIPVSVHSGTVDFALSANGKLVAVHGRSIESVPGGVPQYAATDWIQTWWWGACPDPGRPIRIPESVGTITISPDARWIAASGDANVRVWDALTGLERFRIPQSQMRAAAGDIARSLAFSPDGGILYSIHSSQHPMLSWDLGASLSPAETQPPPRAP